MAIDLANFASGGPWGVYWPGCCCGCLIGSDRFDRELSTNVGGAWTELSGDWAVGDILGEGGNEGAIIKYNLPAPSENMVIYVDTLDEKEGDVYRVILNATEDFSKYHYVDFVVDEYDPEYGLVRWWEFYSHDDETGEQLIKRERVYGATLDPPLRTGRQLFICIGGNRLEDGSLGDQYISASASWTVLGTSWTGVVDLIPGGVYAGLGNGGTSTIYYDNWYLYKHQVDDPNCPSCTCVCDGRLWPLELSLRVYSTGRCEVDQTITLSYNRVDARWKWDGVITGSGGRTATFHFSLACDDEYGDGLLLGVTSEGSCTADTPPTAVNYHIQKPIGGSCNPVDLTYKITIPSTWLTCSLCGGGLPPPVTDIYFYVTE